ncbi:MAG: class I SAM-dependent methyltransferase, partial [Candidatus Krumholzibacteria bacterium]|nr:class I SAM-dependent methyltransferase [Candidatus Krumholzibacteria bacterium]
MEWYEIAFDRIYPVLYRHRDDDEAEMVLDAFGDLIAGRDPVLDLACGNGRYMVSADKRDLRTWGVDLSEFLLGEATNRNGLSGRLVCADMRRLPFGGGVFGVVLNMFTSFGYFVADMDNLLVLREVSRVLRTGGM